MAKGSEQSIPIAASTSVRTVLEQVDLSSVLRLVAGADGLDRELSHPRIQKSGLALVGHDRGIVPTRIQILGETEVTFLEALEPQVRRESVEHFLEHELSLVVLTRGVEPMPELLTAARATGTPLVVSELRSSRTIHRVHAALDDLLAPNATMHGVLVDIHGIGTLLRGPSGIGKSECALFLLERGHRLVADDQVMLRVHPSGHVVGRPPPLLRHHLEVRGLGIMNVRDLFGATAVRDDKVLHLVLDLMPWVPGSDYDRLGVEDLFEDVLGVQVPMLRIPVTTGRNMAVILEVAARNQLLKRAGHHAARRFVETLSGSLGVPNRTDEP